MPSVDSTLVLSENLMSISLSRIKSKSPSDLLWLLQCLDMGLQHIFPSLELQHPFLVPKICGLVPVLSLEYCYVGSISETSLFLMHACLFLQVYSLWPEKCPSKYSSVPSLMYCILLSIMLFMFCFWNRFKSRENLKDIIWRRESMQL